MSGCDSITASLRALSEAGNSAAEQQNLSFLNSVHCLSAETLRSPKLKFAGSSPVEDTRIAYQALYCLGVYLAEHTEQFGGSLPPSARCVGFDRKSHFYKKYSV